MRSTESNFLNTVALVQGQAAFVLYEPGFLGNSTSLSLRNNVWQGVVPLPGAARSLSGLGAFGAGSAERRKDPAGGVMTPQIRSNFRGARA